jgi:hypothetical protein
MTLCRKFVSGQYYLLYCRYLNFHTSYSPSLRLIFCWIAIYLSVQWCQQGMYIKIYILNSYINHHLGYYFRPMIFSTPNINRKLICRLSFYSTNSRVQSNENKYDITFSLRFYSISHGQEFSFFYGLIVVVRACCEQSWCFTVSVAGPARVAICVSRRSQTCGAIVPKSLESPFGYRSAR